MAGECYLLAVCCTAGCQYEARQASWPSVKAPMQRRVETVAGQSSSRRCSGLALNCSTPAAPRQRLIPPQHAHCAISPPDHPHTPTMLASATSHALHMPQRHVSLAAAARRGPLAARRLPVAAAAPRCAARQKVRPPGLPVAAAAHPCASALQSMPAALSAPPTCSPACTSLACRSRQQPRRSPRQPSSRRGLPPRRPCWAARLPARQTSPPSPRRRPQRWPGH